MKWVYAAMLTAMAFALLNTPFWWLVFVGMPFLWAEYFK